ncbi:MAG: DUF5706 domain-containing protein [Bacteroidia bacterium]|nr:DUF5706 domain-containing protein [Bacteroidia bacterium]
MTMDVSPALLTAAEQYATEQLTTELPGDYSYHTIDHTRQVVMAAGLIGTHTGLTENEIRLVQLAAWFHDLGYIRQYIQHEDQSRIMAKGFLESHDASPVILQYVDDLISATKLDCEPRNALEEVLKDADLYNLATTEALENSQKIRQEWKVFFNREYTDQEWDEFNYNFFKNFEYYTQYARENLEPLKQENQRKIKKNIKKRRKVAVVADRSTLEGVVESQEEQIEKLQRKLKKIRNERPERGVETMFRTTYRTHISLSDLADSKANTLLSINAIVISIIFSNALTGKELFPNAVYPVFGILGVCMLTIIFAILATRPKISSGTFTREDILNKKTNLLFFGNFYKMSLDDYLWGVSQMMNDAEYLYGSMTKDIYFLGRVLDKKFRLLRLAYNVFMYGMGVCLLAFLIIYLLSFGK